MADVGLSSENWWMHALHKKLREKREFYYEPRHVVGAALGLLVFGAGMFYSGLVIGKRAEHSTSDTPSAVGQSGDASARLAMLGRANVLLNQDLLLGEVEELEKAEPNLVNVAELGRPIPAKVPRARKPTGRRIIRAKGPVPAEVQKAVEERPEITMEDLTRVSTMSMRATNITVAEVGSRSASDSARVMGPMMADAFQEVYAEAPSKVAEPETMKAATFGVPPLNGNMIKRGRAARVKSAKKAKGKPVAEDDRRAFTIQIHAFKSKGTAEEVASAIGNFQGHRTLVKKQIRGQSEWFRVQIGSFPNLRNARSYQQAFEAHKGLANTFLVSM
jgi:cell division septation protein DedD